MLISSTITHVRKAIAAAYVKKLRVGFVPTMGALHDGHISLVKRAKKDCGFVVVSLFVNPIQFGAGEDLDRYPRTFDADKKLLRDAGADILFAPNTQDMYEADHSVYVNEKILSMGLCGASRRGHFDGVCTVVAKLFNIVNPDTAYFGQKDYQQVCVVKRMVRDLNFPVKIKVCPTVREKDGLAMSSRNRYLSDSERVKALVLYEALSFGKELIKKGERSSDAIVAAMRAVIARCPQARVDYLAVRKADTLQDMDRVSGKIVLLGAIKIGNTRLIDNILV